MSTFTNWNGPGDVAGDLSIFYQQLQELTRLTNQASQNYAALQNIVNSFNGKVSALEAATGNTISDDLHQNFRDLIGNFNTLKTAFDAYTTGTGSAMKTGALEAASATIKGLLKVEGNFIVDEAFSIDHAKKVIESLYDWIHLAQWFYFNTAAEYQDIRFKIGGANDPTDTVANNAINSRMKPNLITQTGDIPVAIVDLVESAGYTHGTGTIYVAVRNTIHLDAVINIAAHHDSPADIAATMSVTYAYHKQGTANQQIIFSLRHVTFPNGGNGIVVYISGDPGFGASTFTNVWVHGRGVRRWDTGDPTASGPGFVRLITPTGERGAGFLADRSTFNSLLVRNDVDIQGNLSVIGQSVFFDNTTFNGNNNTFKHDVNIEGTGIIKDLIVTNSAIFEGTGDVSFGGNLITDGTLEVKNIGGVDPALNVHGNSKLDGDIDAKPHQLQVGDAWVANLFVGEDGVVKTDAVVALTDDEDNTRFLVRFEPGSATGTKVVSTRVNIALIGLNAPAITDPDEKDQLIELCRAYQENELEFIAHSPSNYSYIKLTILKQWDQIAKTINDRADQANLPQSIERIATTSSNQCPVYFDLNGTRYYDPIRSNTHRTFSLDEIYRVDKSGGTVDKVIVGHFNASDTNTKRAQVVLESLGRPLAKVQAADHELAYLEDVITGLFYRGNVDMVITGDPMAWEDPVTGIPKVITEIPLVDGTFKQIVDGMLLLRRGFLNTQVTDPVTNLPDPNHPVYFPGEETRLYKAKNVVIDTTTGKTLSVQWELCLDVPAEAPGGIYTPPPYMPTKTYGIYQWTGYVQYDNPRFSYEYIIWDVNRGVDSLEQQWQIVNIALEGYRLAVDQDRIDEQLAILSYALQPDWLEKNPTIDISIPGVPSRIPNPSFIQNKPIMGISELSAGCWDNASGQTPFSYDYLVMGGDYLEFYENIRDSVTAPLTDQPIRDVILQLMHGNVSSSYAELPPATQNTAYSLKWVIKKDGQPCNELYIDTGNPDFTYPGLVTRKGNILLFPTAGGGGGGGGALEGPIDIDGDPLVELTGQEIDTGPMQLVVGTHYIIRKRESSSPNGPYTVYLVNRIAGTSPNEYNVQVIQSAGPGGLFLKRYVTSQGNIGMVDPNDPNGPAALGYAIGKTLTSLYTMLQQGTNNDLNLAHDLISIRHDEQNPNKAGAPENLTYKLNIQFKPDNFMTSLEMQDQPAFVPWNDFQFAYIEGDADSYPLCYGWVDFSIDDIIVVNTPDENGNNPGYKIYKVRPEILASEFTWLIEQPSDIWKVIKIGTSPDDTADDGQGNNPTTGSWFFQDVTADYPTFTAGSYNPDQIVRTDNDAKHFYRCMYGPANYTAITNTRPREFLLSVEPKAPPSLTENFERSAPREGFFFPVAYQSREFSNANRQDAQHEWDTFLDFWTTMALYPPSACTTDCDPVNPNDGRFPTATYGGQNVTGYNRRAPKEEFPEPGDPLYPTFPLPDTLESGRSFYPVYKKWQGRDTVENRDLAPMYFPYWFETFESQAEWIEP